MMIDDIKGFVENTLAQPIVYNLPNHPEVGVIASPVTYRWVALIIHGEHEDVMDLYGGSTADALRKKSYHDPYLINNEDYVGIALDGSLSFEEIKNDLLYAWQKLLIPDNKTRCMREKDGCFHVITIE